MESAFADRTDDGLFSELVSDLRLEGGCCELDILIVLNPKIRKMLGDRRLLAFLTEHPHAHAMLRVERSCSTEGSEEVSGKAKGRIVDKVYLLPQCMHGDPLEEINKRRGISENLCVDGAGRGKEYKCNKCGELFQSRNRLFCHVKSDCASKATPAGEEDGSDVTGSSSLSPQYHRGKLATELLFKVATVLNTFSHPLVPLRWVASRSVIRWNLRLYLRSLPLHIFPVLERHEFDTRDWWEEATRRLMELLRHHGDTFTLSAGTGEVRKSTSNSCDTDESSTRDNSAVATCKGKLLPYEVYLSFAQKQEASSGVPPLQTIVAEVVGRIIRRERVSLKRIQTEKSIREWLTTNRVRNITIENILESCPHLEVLEDKQADTVFVVKSRERAETGLHQLSADIAEMKLDVASHARQSITVDVIFRNERLLVINKAAGVKMEALVDSCNEGNVPGPTAIEKSSYVIDSVSRLDQTTSGTVVLPLSKVEEEHLTGQFKNRLVDKWYICITTGSTAMPRSGEVSAKLKHTGGDTLKTFVHHAGKESLTKFYVVNTFCIASTSRAHDVGSAFYHIVMCKPVTGRTHQIRAHMSHIGFPLVGDAKYAGNSFRRSIYRVNKCLEGERAMLHSYRVHLTDSTGEAIAAVSPVPEDMKQLYQKLRSMQHIGDDSSVILESENIEVELEKAMVEAASILCS